MLAAVFSQHTGIFHLVLGVVSLDALHRQPAVTVNSETSPHRQSWFGKHT